MGREVLLAIVVGCVAFAGGIVIGWSSGHDAAPSPPEAPSKSQPTEARPASPTTDVASHAWRRSGSDMVRPLLGCEPPDEGGLETLRAPIEAIVDRARRAGRVEQVGVYVHDLASGHWLGLGSDRLFVPASLTKVPLLMALLRVEEAERGALERSIFYPPGMRHNDRQSIRPGGLIHPGRAWPLGRVAEAMIVESDNNAAFLVRGHLDPALMQRVYLDLGWRERAVVVGGVERVGISPKAVGGTFQALYNATYLGEGTSDLALRLLSRARMTGGLVAGVAPGVTVAHKFGERSESLDDGSTVGLFHDCGIVYRPRRPYVLCVMTRSDSADQRPLIEVVAEISRASWSGFEALPPID